MKHDAAALAASVPRISLSLDKVAIALDVSPNSVLRMVEEGRLPRPRVWHTRKLWRVVEIDAALAEWPTEGEEAALDGDEARWSAD